MVRVWIKAFFAENGAETVTVQIEPISIPERAGAFLLLGTTVLIGLWPGLLLDLITPTLLHSPLFQPLLKGGSP
jgi:NADH-quinone oxidoreductase subunit M